MTLGFAVGAVVLIAIAVLFASRVRMLGVVGPAAFPVAMTGRYQPMLRLLRDEEFAFASNNKALRRKLERNRRRILRGYLRCMAKDYGHLLAGIRMIVVHSPVDRPDLVTTLARNRMRFALALCSVEFRLALHQLGIGALDVPGLLGALASLRSAHAMLVAPASVAAA